ncbi:hypothetical protein LAG90_17650 [Marinilongibacter aquaticus]|uniref:hypothetical protein n=1 Tax=Marinilongibacter aquaticus TaxID=2975157 RepID=UPI0021BD974A|nr:hypothetical protein [Marinilongibacter aquaticus]UBM58627.1 hypothetical protein LAG90_17650 [Marinilongibacter aquaticus]
MTLQEAYTFIEKLKDESKSKSEIKLYDRFLYMLMELRKRDFSTEEMQAIEMELESLHVETGTKDRKKKIRNVLREFEKYLMQTFSLVSAGYYTNLGVGLGLSFGAVLGIVFLSSIERGLGIAFGSTFGLLAGTLIGHYLDAQAKAAGNVL